MLLNKEADLIMHSLKDLPGDEEYYANEAFSIGAYLKRDSAKDCLVVRPGLNVEDVLRNGVIGTSSPRRKAFLLHRYPNLKVVHFRGSVLTRSNSGKLSRLDKLDKEHLQELQYGGSIGAPADAIVLAVSGLKRLGLKNRISKAFDKDEMCPAIGQGVIVVEYLTELEKDLGPILAKINHKKTQHLCEAERTMLRRLGGNCHSPIAGHAWIKNNRLYLRGVVLSNDGTYYNKVEKSSEIASPEELGEIVARELNKRGASKVIENSRYQLEN